MISSSIQIYNLLLKLWSILVLVFCHVEQLLFLIVIIIGCSTFRIGCSTFRVYSYILAPDTHGHLAEMQGVFLTAVLLTLFWGDCKTTGSVIQ